MTRQNTQPEPVASLDYATFDTDGLPAHVPEVEALIDARASLRYQRKYSRNDADVLKYFAKSMRRRFALDQLADTCCGCGADCRTVASVKWVVRWPLRTLKINLSNQSAKVNFLTHQTVCDACFIKWNKWERRVWWLSLLSVAVQALTIAVAFPLLFGEASVKRIGIQPDIAWLVWVAVAVLQVPLEFVIQRREIRAAPEGLFPIRSPGVRFVKIESFADRDQLLSPQRDSTEPT